MNSIFFQLIFFILSATPDYTDKITLAHDRISVMSKKIIITDSSDFENWEQFYDLHLNTYERLTKPSFDPYTGHDITPTLCQRKHLPQPITNKNFTIFSLFSSQNGVLGHCDGTNKHWKTQYLILDCGVYYVQVLIHYPKEVAWQTQPLAQCIHKH
jgi:hypothetical protein